MISALQNLNLLKLGALFTLNFIGGFLIYASIFAAIGGLYQCHGRFTTVYDSHYDTDDILPLRRYL